MADPVARARLLLALPLFAGGLAMPAERAVAGPVTFAQVSEGSSGDGVIWSNNGAGTGTLNTARVGGDDVNFAYSNVPGLSGALSGQLSAVETINGGSGVSTTALAGLSGGFDTQAFNTALTISYNLVKPIDGFTNLLTITITPNTPGATGMVLGGQNGGSGAFSSTSQPTVPASTYTMTFSSAFLSFAQNSTISADFSYSSLDPMMLIGADGLLNSFTAEDTATFSSSPSPTSIAVREPGSVGLMATGLIGLCALRRRRAR